MCRLAKPPPTKEQLHPPHLPPLLPPLLPPSRLWEQGRQPRWRPWRWTRPQPPPHHQINHQRATRLETRHHRRSLPVAPPTPTRPPLRTQPRTQLPQRRRCVAASSRGRAIGPSSPTSPRMPRAMLVPPHPHTRLLSTHTRLLGRAACTAYVRGARSRHSETGRDLTWLRRGLLVA